MGFSEDFGDILSPFVEKYKVAKNEKGRKALVKTAADAVLKSKEQLEDKEVELPKDLPLVRRLFLSFSLMFDIHSFRQSLDT